MTFICHDCIKELEKFLSEGRTVAACARCENVKEVLKIRKVDE